MRMTESSKFVTLLAGAMLCGGISVAQTTCSTVGVVVSGFYPYSALGTGAPGSYLTGTSTTGTTGTSGTTGSTTTVSSFGIPVNSAGYSSTEVGMLLSGISTATSTPFASSGTLYLDGAGNVLATYTPVPPTATSPTPSPLTQIVGAYVVYSNCTITVSLTDVFGTNTTATSLQGTILNGGNEIDLGVLQSAASTTGTSTSTTGTAGFFESNVLVKLVRPALPTCSTTTLSGPYVLIGTATGVESATGTSSASTQSEAPFFFFGLVQFDGNGNIVSPPTLTSASTAPAAPSNGMSSSPGLNYLQFTGTYTVNSDCSGSLTMTSSAGAMALTATPTTSTGTSGTTGTTGTTTTTTSVTLDFVIEPATIAINQGASAARYTAPELEFSESSGSQTILGYGIAQ
jgi:hypothetical protein